MSSTDIHCGERKEKNHDSGMIFGDDTSESADDRRNYWKEDDHSAISKVCQHNKYKVILAVGNYSCINSLSLGSSSLGTSFFRESQVTGLSGL